MNREATFLPVPASVAEVRRFAEKSLDSWADDADVVLAVSELATNVVVHAGTEFAVKISREAEGVLLEVTDGGVEPVRVDHRRALSGLRLVGLLANSWGVDHHGEGKTVWAWFGPGTRVD